MVQVSTLPDTYGRQSYTVSVGSAPNLTYMSASPVPPDITNFRFVAPEGTASVYFTYAPVAPLIPVCATPLVSAVAPPPPPPPPALTSACEMAQELVSLDQLACWAKVPVLNAMFAAPPVEPAAIQ